MTKTTILLSALAFVLLMTACHSDKKKTQIEAKQQQSFYYTCSMHPQVHETHPGNCPVCGMKLIKVDQVHEPGMNSIRLTDLQLKLANIHTDTVRETGISTEKVLTGTVTTDENTADQLSARLPGRIEQLFVRSVGEQVRIGEPVYRIYSEELLEAERSFLLAKAQQQQLHNPDMDYQALVAAARQKLKLWGLTTKQIDALARTGQASATTGILSTVGGTVTEIGVHEGDYVTEGFPVLRVYQLNRLWVEAQVYTGEIAQYREGDKVKVDIQELPQQGLSGTISFINPELSDDAALTLIRVGIPNPDGLIRPGMQAKVYTGKSAQVQAVPVPAVLRDGQGSAVWVKNADGSFSAKRIETGEAGNGMIQVRSGLQAGTVVVTSGAYLLNSEMLFRHGTQHNMTGMKM
ncbi:efflux RND transporter periplasmic adaptor subunit [Mucilaginibacter segetis]|uniref:Efflux RND transporter periplasmic adaptor subunit n=1 Tax=Mucilaginibacter segetis TaxID=2793071 RepID=A0A934PTC1_9SPHI|nr:efflux RND transporter periplasmic adaptor subunit [Mucilaginibacter segetis]MBK0379231.1 efflux RND transporter periplasmic adaptor subunit [Mucilaginibacter segetis]